MYYRIFISYIAFVAIVSIVIVTGQGCANIVPPQGGFRDSLPPIMLRVTPDDSTRNFKGNRVNFSFDEYIQVDNFQQNVIVSPIPRVLPTYTYRLNTLSVRLKDSLEPNTTYTINFGNSIKDVNEGNIMKEFTYVFSTGPALDSFTFGGHVLLAQSGQLDTTMLVILHRRGDDSAVVKERPRYMTKLNSKGDFLFRNLPSGTFYVYALKDDARTYRYSGGKQLFAFADSPVVVNQNTPRKTLYAYENAKTNQPPPTTASQNAADKRLKYQTSLKNNNQDLLQKFSFQFERILRRFDSAKVRFAMDTTFIPITNHSWSIDSTKKKVTLNYTWQENTLYHLILEKDFATDTLGQQLLRGDTLSFRTLKNSNYGKLSIRLRNLDLSKNPVLQFVQSGEVVNSFPLTSANFSRPLFLPGDYELRVLNDINKNGIWDAGEFFGKHQQPEIVSPVQRRIVVKENWDNDFEIAL